MIEIEISEELLNAKSPNDVWGDIYCWLIENATGKFIINGWHPIYYSKSKTWDNSHFGNDIGKDFVEFELKEDAMHFKLLWG